MPRLSSSKKRRQTRLKEIKRALKKPILDIDYRVDILTKRFGYISPKDFSKEMRNLEDMVPSVSHVKDWYKLYLASPEVNIFSSGLDILAEDRFLPLSSGPEFKSEYDNLNYPPVIVGEAEVLPIGYFKEGVDKLCEYLDKGWRDRPYSGLSKGGLNSETLFYSLVPYEFQEMRLPYVINSDAIKKEFTKVLESITKFLRNTLNTQYELSSERHTKVSDSAYRDTGKVVDARYFYPENLVREFPKKSSVYIIVIKTPALQWLFSKALSTLKKSPEIAFNKLLSRILPYTADVSTDRFAITDRASTIYIELDHTKSKPSPDGNTYELAIRYRVVRHKDTSLTLRLFLCWFLFTESHKSEEARCEQIDNRIALEKNLDEWYHKSEIYASRSKMEEIKRINQKKKPKRDTKDIERKYMYLKYLKTPNNSIHQVFKDSFKPTIIQFDRDISPAVVLEITNKEFQETFQMETRSSSVIIKLFEGENTLTGRDSVAEGVLKALDFFENEVKAFEIIGKYNQEQIQRNKGEQKLLRIPKFLKAGYLEYYLNIDHCVRIGGFFIAMEKLEGTTPSSLEHFEQVIDQLNILHQEVGIEHGDVRRTNVIVVDGVSHLINFESSEKYPGYDKGDIYSANGMLLDFKEYCNEESAWLECLSEG